jgi:hypothetical protein
VGPARWGGLARSSLAGVAGEDGVEWGGFVRSMIADHDRTVLKPLAERQSEGRPHSTTAMSASRHVSQATGRSVWQCAHVVASSDR